MCNAAREIAIVGGGLAGLVLALCLNNHGFKPTIYEKQPEDFQQGGAIVLSPNALRVLDSLGLYGKLRVKGYPFEGVLLANNSAVGMGTIFLGSEKRFGFPAMRIARSAIKEVLLEEIECQGIEISYKMALSSLLETNIGVEMRFADGSLVQADLVIGTDGIRSVVREYVDSSCRPYYSGVTLIYGTMTRDHLEEEPLDVTFPSMMFGPEGSFVIVPTDYEGNDVGYFASGLLPDRSREEWTKFRLDKVGLRGNIQERFCNGAWPKTVQRLCREAIPENLLAWPIYVLSDTKRWTSPSTRIIIIGDAAHAMSPASTQGAGMAWEDAYTLAYALSKSDSSDETNSSSIKIWEAHRREHLQRVVKYAQFVENTRKPSPNYFLQKIKEWRTWAVLKYSGEEGLAGWMYRYNGETEIGALL